MRKVILMILLCGICQCCIGCTKQTEVVKENNTVRSTPSPNESSKSRNDLLGSVKENPNHTITLHKNVLKILSATPNPYKIQDKSFKRKNHSGKFNVHYPVLMKDQRDLSIVNSVILARVIEELPSEMDDSKLDISLDYKVTLATARLISIVFDGYYNGKNAAHPMNLSFTINYDIENDVLLSFTDIYSNDSFIEMVHSAMKKQLEPELLHGYELLTVEEIENQIYNKDEGFYFNDQKIYVRFMIPSGSGYYGYISFKYQ